MSVNTHKEPSLRDTIAVLFRERRTILIVTGVCLLLAVLACLTSTRRYQASGTMQLQKSASDGLNLNSFMGGDSAADVNDSSSLNTDLQTQTTILQSDALAIRVIESLNLEHNKDFVEHFSAIGWVLGLVSGGGGASDAPNASLEESPNKRQRLLAVFQHNLKVRSIPGTRIIVIEYSNADPRVAAEVVNRLTQALINYTFQTRSEASSQVSAWLQGQLSDLRKSNEEMQTRVAALQKNTGLFGIGGMDPAGKPVIYSPILDRLEHSTTALAQAHENRVLKGAVYQVTKTGDPELISQLGGTSPGAAEGGGSTNTLALIQALRGQEATIQEQIGQDAVKFGSSYPKLIEERSSLSRVQNSLREETARIAARAKNDFAVATEAEDGARATFEADRIQAEKLNDKSIEFTTLSKEALQSQELYQDLLRRLKEAGLLEGLRSSNISVVDKAQPPARPSKPNKLLYLALGMLGGLVCGAATALTSNAVGDKVRDSTDIEQNNIPVLGAIPATNDAKVFDLGSANASDQVTPFGESIRGIRSSLLGRDSASNSRVVLITSGRSGEGKSTLSVSLAESLARLGKRVLLVGADLRKPAFAAMPQADRSVTLNALLRQTSPAGAMIPFKGAPNLYVLEAGNGDAGPSDLLGSETMRRLMERWRLEYDFILLDCAPILAVADAQILTQFADMTIVVVRANFTTRRELRHALEVLSLSRTGLQSVPVSAVISGAAPRLFLNTYYNENRGKWAFLHAWRSL